ncbi:MAG: hypothetical protein ACRYHA_22420 [Janthinobacterium lividum]
MQRTDRLDVLLDGVSAHPDDMRTLEALARRVLMIRHAFIRHFRQARAMTVGPFRVERRVVTTFRGSAPDVALRLPADVSRPVSYCPAIVGGRWRSLAVAEPLPAPSYARLATRNARQAC